VGAHDAVGRVVDVDDAASVAAQFADLARGPELVAESARAARRTAAKRLTRRLIHAAAAMLLLAAGLELWGTYRQLAQVRAERAALRERVSRAMASRDSAATLEAQLGALSSEVRTAPRWSIAIARLADRLPGDAWLESLSAAGDSLSLVGASAQAGDVFEALRRDPAISSVHADAPIRRDMSSDRGTVEHYGVTIRLTPAALTTVPEATP
jgi:Tfp pilus assembly protein PilN